MDKDRKIRFLISPLIFFTSLSLGVYFDPNRTYSDLVPNALLPLHESWNLVGLLVAGGVAAVALGMLIGMLTHVMLRFLFCWRKDGNTYEMWLDSDALSNMSTAIRYATGNRKVLLVGVTYVEDVLHEKREHVHAWLVRRWNSFSIAATSLTALALSVGVGVCPLHVALSCRWMVLVGLGVLCFLAAAWMAWHDMMDMLSFQAQIPDEPKGGPTH